jgi:hypothetical protein
MFWGLRNMGNSKVQNLVKLRYDEWFPNNQLTTLSGHNINKTSCEQPTYVHVLGGFKIWEIARVKI